MTHASSVKARPDAEPRRVSELVSLSEATVIKEGNAFCVAMRDGRLPLADDHPLGIYLADCRPPALMRAVDRRPPGF
jgi:hypothetical protein